MATRHTSIVADFMTFGTRKSQGSRGTRQRMHSTYKQWERISKKHHWGKVTPKNITHHQLCLYVQERIKEGISGHSIQTEIAAIRRAMEGADRYHDAAKLFTNQSLGVPSVSRKGKGIAISDETLERARALACNSVRALIDLQREIGLRLNEAIECKHSLRSWEEALRRGESTIYLTEGSKGGRPRHITILPQNAVTAYAAIVAALAVTNGGYDFPIKASNGRNAARAYTRKLATLGIKARESSHSLRRRFACRQYLWYRENGLDKKEALARLSMDLGHGTSRGRWAYNNYLRNSLPEEGDA